MPNSRAGRRVDIGARRDEWAVVRRIGWRLAVPPLVGCALGAALVLLRPSVLGGFSAGVIVTATFALLAFLVVQEAGTVARRAGADAERFTSQSLRPAIRAGWLRFDHLPFGRFDVDHVLIGPDRAYALETKWSATAWHDDHPQLRRALGQARTNARKARLLLGSKDIGHAIEVDPVLVLWGAVDGLTTGVLVDDVLVLRGRDVKDWARGRDEVPAAARPGLGIVADRMDTHLARHRPADGPSDDEAVYVRVGLDDMANRLGAVSLGFAAGFAVIALALWVWSWAGIGAMVVICAAGAVVARRRTSLAPWAVGAAVAGFGSLLWLAVLVVGG